ncbi:hypothetical protein DFJ63DRAFT_316696 [Scheffersomyces coipomensis]|uniref:uncharacterized protein n=1 Tax=Scheffersomyces coipomensis TaxID=1788519 RepID=UPI00315D2C39
MAPPTTPAITSPVVQLKKLAGTQQFYWFLGHVLGILFFVLNFITSFFSTRLALRYYRFTLLSIFVTYIIVIKQIFFRNNKLEIKSVTKFLNDDNVQYFGLAIILYLSSFKIGITSGALYSFVIFSVFHVLTYFQNNLLKVSVSNVRTQQYLNSIINQFTSDYNERALFLAASSEVVLSLMSLFQLIPTILINLLFKWEIIFVFVKLITILAIVVFTKLRFDSNKYTKAVIQEYDQRANQYLIRIPQLNQLYNGWLKGEFIPKYVQPIKVPVYKEVSKKTQ